MECLILTAAAQRFCFKHPIVTALALALAVIGLTRLARFVGAKVLPPVWRGIGKLFLRLFRIGRQLFVPLFTKRRPPVQLPAIPFVLAAAPIGAHLLHQVSPFLPKAISIAPSFLHAVNPLAPFLSSAQSLGLDASQLWAAQPVLSSGLLLCTFSGLLQPTVRRTFSRLGSLISNLVARPVGRFLRWALGARISVPRVMVAGIGLHWALRLGHSTGHLIAHLPFLKTILDSRSTLGLATVTVAILIFKKLRRKVLKGGGVGGVLVDDVTQMNECEMQRVFMVATEEDVQAVVRAAQLKGCQVSMRGQSHTMGGHILAPGGFLIDTKYLNSMHYDPAFQTVSVGPGATWGDLIKYLNDFGMSPMIMQSYCSFSVGGSISVNAHGITADCAMHEAVLRLRLVDAKGNVSNCSRNENTELFSLVIGGYGLFGVLTEVTLRVVPNVKIALESLNLDRHQFVDAYTPLLTDPAVEMKLARVELTWHKFNRISLYTSRRSNKGQPTVSDLPEGPRQMSPAGALIFKWLLPLRIVQKLRFALERLLRVPLDWQREVDRNCILYESAYPLAHLVAPLVRLNQTHVLQEYFVPHHRFADWMEIATGVLSDAHCDIKLLNITIRYIQPDTTTFLRYARCPSFAFVLYFRLPCTPEGDAALGAVHRALVDATLRLGGTFYLPYRPHYSPEELRTAYPNIGDFFRLKAKHDPDNIFSNIWFTKYGKEYVSVARQGTSPTSVRPNFADVSNGVGACNQFRITGSSEQSCPSASALLSGDFFAAPKRARGYAPVPIDTVSEHRTNSYRAVLGSDALRARLQLFLRHVFHVESPDAMYSYVCQAAMGPKDKNDNQVFADLQRILDERHAMHKFGSQLLTLKQLMQQKADIVNQVATCVSLLGFGGRLQTLLTLGDAGRHVVGLRRALGMRGRAFVAHDSARFVADALERGRPWPVGESIACDYQTLPELPLPPGSVDLVTVMMGLHHLPQERLGAFLADVRRILAPGGLLIIREHDATPDLVPLLDLAHSIFNAATGVSAAEEASEVRAFRPIAAWRALARATGFVDLMVRAHDPKDPTDDVMLCFMKPLTAGRPIHGAKVLLGHVAPRERFSLVASASADVRPKGASSHWDLLAGDVLGEYGQLDAAINEQLLAYERTLIRDSHAFNFFRLPEWMLVHVPKSFAASLDHTAWFRFPFVRHVALYWRVCAAEAAAAARAHGVGRGVLANRGFHMAVVIGAVLTFVFGQMWLLALPLRLGLGEATPEEYEDLLLVAQASESDAAVDRWTSTGQLDNGSQCWRIVIDRTPLATKSRNDAHDKFKRTQLISAGQLFMEAQSLTKTDRLEPTGQLQNGAVERANAKPPPLNETLAGLHPSATCHALDVPWERIPGALVGKLEGLGVSAGARVPLLVMRVPKHVPFTEILQELSAMTERVGSRPRIHLLAISCLYDATCQVELRVASPVQRAWAARQDGCELVFSFTYPDTHSPKKEDLEEHIILAVRIWRLLPFLADCNGTEGVTVVQVFDFQET